MLQIMFLAALMASAPAMENHLRKQQNQSVPPITQLALKVSLDGEDLAWSDQALRETIAAYLTAKGVQIVEQPADAPAEESVPILVFWISAGPEICRTTLSWTVSNHCDRLSVEFWEPVRLLRDPDRIVMARTIEWSVGSPYQHETELYRSEIKPERLKERTLDMMETLYQILSGTFPGSGSRGEARN